MIVAYRPSTPSHRSDARETRTEGRPFAGTVSSVGGWRSPESLLAAADRQRTPVPARHPEDEFEECERWDGMA